MKWKFFFPGRLPSMNRLLRMHWAPRKKLQAGLVAKAQLIIPPEAYVKEEHPRRSVRCIMLRKKLLDADNAYGAIKPLLDAIKTIYKRGNLTQIGVIFDDSNEFCYLDVRQMTLKACPEEYYTNSQSRHMREQNEEGTWVEVDTACPQR